MERISYAATGRFAPIVLDYLNDDERLREHRQYAFSKEGLMQAVAERQFPAHARQQLVAALARQYSGLQPHEAVRATIDRLANDGTLTVTAGHQLCLFTGPLYVPLKIMNTVRLARDLSSWTGRAVVPVFWLASEDHDRAEVDHAWLHGKKVEWTGIAGGAVGRMKLQGIGAVLDNAIALLGKGPFAEEIEGHLRAAYTEDRTLTEATRHFINAMFGRYGVVCLDGDDPHLKRQFTPVLGEELLNQVTARTVQYANAKLGEHYSEQAHVRDINLFLLGEGRRDRISVEDNGYSVSGEARKHSADELVGLSQQAPELFSPNVLLRPVYQETVLPNVAYIGGGGEVAYWLQLRWLFQGMRVPMPVVVLRTSAQLMSRADVDRLKELGLAPSDLFAPLDTVNARLASSLSTIDTDLSIEHTELSAFYSKLAARAKGIDPTLEASVLGEGQKALKGLESVGGKFVRAAKRDQELALSRLAKIHERFLPGGALHERRDNFLPWYVEHGPALLDRLLAIDPLEKQMTILRF
ncbi:MAG: bacillithiol biosynthesis cysteine-adding enzyme BshC [Flavobacteriales bacterium]|nr:MAG: bacillithiol biosynthesis cysteine-adding enzyme BshC [Flavobacteriales bacterium]